MMTKRLRNVLCLLCVLPTGTAQALEMPGNWAGKWSGHADLGYTAASGNSETSHLNAGFGLQYEIAPWVHSFDLDMLKEEEGGNDTSDRLEAEFKSKYALSEVSYVFGVLIYERDEFGGVRERTSETLGYGRKFLNNELHTLEAEIGVGARQSELADGSDEEDAILRFAGHYHRHISESATFDQGLLVEAGDTNTYVESESALKLKINGNLYAKLSYTIKYNDTVTAGVENTDSYTSVNLSYEF